MLIVDDQAQYGDFIAKVARTIGFEAEAIERVDAFLLRLEMFQPTVVVIDLVMPEMDGVALLRALRDRNCTAAILVTSGLDVRTLSWAEGVGRELGLNIAGLIPKPVRAAELRSTLQGL